MSIGFDPTVGKKESRKIDINLDEYRRLEEDTKNYIRKLQEEQSRFLASINSLPLGFIIVDVKNNILIKNQAVDQILGLEDMEGTTFLRGDVGNIEEKLRGSFDLKRQWERCLREHKTVDIRDIEFGGKFLRIFVAPVTMIGEASETIGVVILIEDITAAKVIERSKDEFFSIASHELRTPLTSIRGNAAMIKDFYSDKLKDKELKEMIDDIHESSVRLIEIVNDFLNLSRLEQKKIIFQKQEFDVTKLAEKVIYELGTIAKQKDLYLRLEDGATPPHFVIADEGRVEQVLYNLLGNSLKFTDKGGVLARIQPQNGFVKISVIDTGRGVPVPNQALLFRKFQQAGESLLTRDTTKGTGLGLYISKMMVEGMGGEIKLESSEEGKGSTFFFTLPFTRELPKASEPKPVVKSQSSII